MPHLMGTPRLSWLLVVPLAIAMATSARAQEPLTRAEQNVVNFAFATQLGSGVYSVSGRTLQIYRLPFSYTLKSDEDSRFGIELTLPVTLGFYDFELQDVAEGDIPTDVDTVSFVPGLKLVFELNPGWWLEPYAEAGLSRARDEVDATVYAAGLVSLYDFDGKGFECQLRNDLVYAGVDIHGDLGSDRFTRFQTVVTARRPFGAEAGVDYLLYVLNDYYVDQPDGPISSANRGNGAMQYEVGITLGTSAPRRVWGIPLPRVGVGYRFGSDLDVFRIVFGTPF
jgi:hypothetical protein